MAPEEVDEQGVMTSRPVGSLVGRRVVDVPPGATLRDAIAKLVDNDIGVVAVREGERFKGILSERDLIDAVHERADLDAVIVDELMSPDLITVDPAMSVVDAARTMMDRGVRHLVVEGPDGGIISIRAAMKSILASLDAD